MALPAEFLADLRARTPLPALISRRVKLSRAGRLQKGCCPFHNEKTPSFYVYEDHAHCFGCGWHGDAISYVMSSTGAGFLEAVEQLAQEVGLEVPRDPAAAAAVRRQHDVVSALTSAQAVFQKWLYEPQGRAALAYLRSRGLTDDVILAYGIGWSGDGRGALAGELVKEGIEVGLLVEAGLMRQGGNAPAYDLFFNRVMFPIRDRRGSVISFSGRAMGEAQPKYLNGPETPLFAKRRTLYGLDMARHAVRDGADLIPVEGQMDVIAAHVAGFGGAVAPLGSALTVEHFEELWKLSPCPVLCFDGDAAGLRAAAKAIEGVLPRLTPERTMRVARMPEGDDPDSLIRGHGAHAFRGVIDAAQPLSVALFDLLRGDSVGRTPEVQGAFRARLVAAAASIADKYLAREYRVDLLRRYYELRPWRRDTPNVTRLDRPRPNGDAVSVERARVLLAILIRHPDLIASVEHVMWDVPLCPDHARLWEAMWGWVDEIDDPLDAIFDGKGVSNLVPGVLSSEPLALPAAAGAHASREEAEQCWWQYHALLTDQGRLDSEIETARQAFLAECDERTQARFLALCAAREAVQAGE